MFSMSRAWIGCQRVPVDPRPGITILEQGVNPVYQVRQSLISLIVNYLGISGKIMILCRCVHERYYYRDMQTQVLAESEVFSSVGDLPLHPLVVHFAVALLPVAALLLVAAAIVPALRRRVLGLSVIGVLVGTVATFVSKESGEALAETVGLPAEHAEWADRLMVGSVILSVLAVIWWIVSRRVDGVRRSAATSPWGTADGGVRNRTPRKGGLLGTVLGLLTAIAAVFVLVFAIFTGHSGAQAVWSGSPTESTGESSTAAGGAVAATEGSSSDSQTYAMSDVEQHDNSESCWVAMDGNVYDLTDWIAKHPGGQEAINGLCGTDATEAFQQQHGSNEEAQSALADFKIGALED